MEEHGRVFIRISSGNLTKFTGGKDAYMRFFFINSVNELFSNSYDYISIDGQNRKVSKVYYSGITE